MADIYARTRHIEGTTAEWALNNLILGDGELAIERRVDGPVLRVGDGVLQALSAPVIAAIAEYILYNNSNVALALDAHRVESMIDMVAGSWDGIDQLQVLSFYGAWATSAGPAGRMLWHFDGTLGGTPTAPNNAAILAAMATGKVISADGRGYVLSKNSVLFLSQFGGVSGSNNSAALSAMLTLAAARRIGCTVDADSTLAGVALPTYTDLKVRANLTHSSSASSMLTITNSDYVKLDFGMEQGFSITRSGDERIIYITGTSDYANEHIEIRNFRITGGTLTAIEWFACRNIWFIRGRIDSIAGSAIYSNSNPVTNPYKSRSVVFYDVEITNVTGVSTSHAISINSWAYVDFVWINKCYVSDIRNNGYEIWANHVHCWDNYAANCAIPYSFGACHYLHVHDNEGNTTVPNLTGSGVYGIEIGGCHFFNVHHNIMRGMRNGIRATGSNVNLGLAWYSTTNLYSEAGTLDPADTNKLRILVSDYTGILSGAFFGIIDSNIVIDSLNSGIYMNMDYMQTRAVKISNNLISRVGRYDAPTETQGAITCRLGRYHVENNTIEDVLGTAIFNENSRVILGPNVIRKCDTALPLSVNGLSASYNFLSRQDISQSAVAGVLAATLPTQGTWYAGDTIYSHTPAAAGSLGMVCTTPGTQSTQLNTRTATTTNGSAAVVLAPNIGDAQIGVRLTIAGVTGIKTIVDVNNATSTITLDSVADASVAGAAVANSAAVFKALPSIAA